MINCIVAAEVYACMLLLQISPVFTLFHLAIVWKIDDHESYARLTQARKYDVFSIFHSRLLQL